MNATRLSRGEWLQFATASGLAAAGSTLCAESMRVAGQAGESAQSPIPWLENKPLVRMQREVYQEHPAKGTGTWVKVRYAGPGMLREEIHTHQSSSDTP
jgi:hypothetical protein